MFLKSSVYILLFVLAGYFLIVPSVSYDTTLKKAAASYLEEFAEASSPSDMSVVIKTEYDLKGHRLNINTATDKQLMLLEGIGAVLSKRIVEYRTENGNFKAITDILNVRGIGKSHYSKIKDYITVGEDRNK